MSEGFDLAHAAAEIEAEDQGRVVHIRGRSGEPLYFGDSEPVTMTVVGSYSRRYREAQAAASNRRLKRRQIVLSAEKLTREARELVADCVLDWSGFFDAGTPLECTKDNVVRALEVEWIFEQVQQAMESHADFFAAASTNSSG